MNEISLILGSRLSIWNVPDKKELYLFVPVRKNSKTSETLGILSAHIAAQKRYRFKLNTNKNKHITFSICTCHWWQCRILKRPG